MELYENSQAPEKALLAGVDTGAYDTDSSFDELEELTLTAGAEVIARILQNREKPDGATYVGKGKLEEIKEFRQANGIDLIVFDGELSPSQLQNIEDATDVRVIDRAKCLLIQYRGMTEEQAHRAIEKQAMDTRQTRVAVAQTVINHYDE